MALLLSGMAGAATGHAHIASSFGWAAFFAVRPSETRTWVSIASSTLPQPQVRIGSPALRVPVRGWLGRQWRMAHG